MPIWNSHWFWWKWEKAGRKKWLLPGLQMVALDSHQRGSHAYSNSNSNLNFNFQLQPDLNGGKRNMPVEEWVVKWKRNRNHRGEEILPKKKALALAEKKIALGFKVRFKKLTRNYQPTWQSIKPRWSLFVWPRGYFFIFYLEDEYRAGIFSGSLAVYTSLTRATISSFSFKFLN